MTDVARYRRDNSDTSDVRPGPDAPAKAIVTTVTNVTREVFVTVLDGGRLDRKNAARFLNRAPKTLSEWGRLGVGPKPFKVRGRILYYWADVQAYGAGEAVDHG